MTDSVCVFRALHAQNEPLILANAWDAPSARLFEQAGAKAISATSAGEAWALGDGNGRRMPIQEAVEVAARIMRVIDVPLSVDIENGYSDDPKVVAENVMRLVDIGVAGINIEDWRDDAALLAAKIWAIRNAVERRGGDLFINARSDVYLAQIGEESQRIEESMLRAELYADSSADCFFLPAVHRAQDIQAVIGGIELPLNVLLWPGLPNTAELARLGVHRRSAGSAIPQLLWAQAYQLAAGFLHDGSSRPSVGESPPLTQLLGFFSGNPARLVPRTK